MPPLQSIRDERRKAEDGVKIIKSRIRLLRDVSAAKEKRLHREKEQVRARAEIAGDKEWQRDALETEFMRREMGSMEKRMLASEARDVTHHQLRQSKALVAAQRAAVASKVRAETSFKLEAAYDAKQAEYERRRELAQHGRRHRQWYKEVSANAKEEYQVRVFESRAMAAAEEETRRWMIKEESEKFKNTLAVEEQRLKEVRELAAEQIRASEWARAEEPMLCFGVSGAGGGGRKATQYRIAGPGMATVVKRGEALHRVHFPFAPADEGGFAFAPGSGLVRQPTHGVRQRRIIRGGY